MKAVRVILCGLGAFAFLAVPSVVRAQVRITEFMYQGSGTNGEFVELTNLSPATVDFTGWSFDDDSRTAGSTSLSAFGLVASGQSVLITDIDPTVFRNDWSLAPTVLIIGNNANNLGRADEINVFDASSTLVDRLTYGDQTFPGTVRTQNVSAWTTTNNLGANNISGWRLSATGDAQGSTPSGAAEIGSPGRFVAVAVPEPSAWAMLATLGGVGAALAAVRRRRAVVG